MYSSCITMSFNEVCFSPKRVCKASARNRTIKIQKAVLSLSSVSCMSLQATFSFTIFKLKSFFPHAVSAPHPKGHKIYFTVSQNTHLCEMQLSSLPQIFLLQTCFKRSFIPNLEDLPCQFHFRIGLLLG